MKNNPIFELIGAGIVLYSLFSLDKGNKQQKEAEERANASDERARIAEQRADASNQQADKVVARNAKLEQSNAELVQKVRALEAEKAVTKPSTPRKMDFPKSKK